jgi:hypothetical protein
LTDRQNQEWKTYRWHGKANQHGQGGLLAEGASGKAQQSEFQERSSQGRGRRRPLTNRAQTASQPFLDPDQTWTPHGVTAFLVHRVGFVSDFVVAVQAVACQELILHAVISVKHYQGTRERP